MYMYVYICLSVYLSVCLYVTEKRCETRNRYVRERVRESSMNVRERECDRMRGLNLCMTASDRGVEKKRRKERIPNVEPHRFT